MGIIINKDKGGLLISDLLDQVGINGDMKIADGPVLNGGPVDIDRGFVLHSSDYFKTEATLKISDTMSLTSTKDILESLVTDAHPRQVLLAVGYAGWGAGQLEKEIAENSWLITDADEDVIFSVDFEGKWATALSDMGIDPMSLSHRGGQA